MTTRFYARLLVVSAWLAGSGTDVHAITVEFDGPDPEAFSEPARAVIVSIAEATEAEVRRWLPQLPDDITVTVSAGTNVIPETGTGAASLERNHISWIIDTSRPEGIIEVARKNLRSNLFHEMHHLARGWVISGGEPVTSIMDAVVSEGMATVFERDFAGSEPLWGDYPDNVAEWTAELQALPVSALASYDQWIFQHADGRRWIGYRSGTYIVDRAMAESGMSSAELVEFPTDEVLELAGLGTQ